MAPASCLWPFKTCSVDLAQDEHNVQDPLNASRLYALAVSGLTVHRRRYVLDLVFRHRTKKRNSLGGSRVTEPVAEDMINLGHRTQGTNTRTLCMAPGNPGTGRILQLLARLVLCWLH